MSTVSIVASFVGFVVRLPSNVYFYTARDLHSPLQFATTAPGELTKLA